MIPSNINTAITQAVSSSSKDSALTLRVGQSVTFSLISQTGNQAVISLGGQKLTALIPNPLPEGKPLQATIKQLEPSIKLEIRPASNQNSQNILNQTLKNLLPLQTPVKNEVQQLLNLQTSGRLPQAVQSQLTSLINTMLRINPAVNGMDVRNAFANSGLFLENRLFNGKTTKKDFKANLMKLLDRLESSQAKTATAETTQLQKSAKQLLSKVTIQQIQAIESQAINLELPVIANNASIALKVDIRKREFDDNTIWEIVTELNLNEGKMTVKSILASDEITFQMWADSHALLEKVKSNINSFKSLLENSDIQYKNIFFLEQPPIVDKQATRVALIDIKV